MSGFFETPWIVARQAPLSVGFPRQEYWSGLPFPSPGELPKLGIKSASPTLQVDSLPSEPPGKSFYHHTKGGERESAGTATPTLYNPRSESESHSVVSDSLQPRGLYSAWNSPGQNTGVGSLSFLQGIFPTQGSKPGLPHCRWILYQLSHKRIYNPRSQPL